MVNLRSDPHTLGLTDSRTLGLRVPSVALYTASLVAFAACLLTHESSATLLVMMIAAEATVLWEERTRPDLRSIARRAACYIPFAMLLGGSLAITYIVNSRSYLIQEGHYQFGWHAVPHTIDYLITLWVGTRDVVSKVLMLAVLAALALRGRPRVRFFVFWTIVTIAPSAFFTWGNVSRYLYLPAAGFAMLVAEGLLWLARSLRSRMSPRVARIVVVAVATVLAVRFAAFAAKVPAGFREWTRPYERFAAAVRKANGAPTEGATVYLQPADVENVPVLYRDPAAEVASCGPDVHVVVR